MIPILLTQTKWTHVFQLGKDYKISPIKFTKYQDLILSPMFTPPCLFDLPGELIMKTLQISFFDLLYSKNFQDAFEIVLCNRLIAKQIYTLLFGYATIPVTEMIKRLHSSLYLIDIFYDEYLTVPNGLKVHRKAIRLERKSARTAITAPWDYYHEIQLEGHGRQQSSDGPANPYLTGPYYGDIIHVYGKSTDGIVYAEEIKHPVFTFILSTLNKTLIPNESNFWRNKYFKKFSDLLKIIFGKNTGIYFMVKPAGNDDNPFISTSDCYVKF